MILVVDNYDSFTFNLVQALQAAGADVRVVRNDAIDRAGVEALADDPDGATCAASSSRPGPGDPDDAGVSVDAIQVAADREIPLLGRVPRDAVDGGGVRRASIVRAPTLVHGEASEVTHDGAGLLEGMPPAFMAARYHSLAVDPATLPAELRVTAMSEVDRVVMGIRHVDAAARRRPVPPRERADAAGPAPARELPPPGRGGRGLPARRRDRLVRDRRAGRADRRSEASSDERRRPRRARDDRRRRHAVARRGPRSRWAPSWTARRRPPSWRRCSMGLRMRGETVDELAGFATAMRERVAPGRGARGRDRRRRDRRRRQRHVQHLDRPPRSSSRPRASRSPSTATGRSRRRRGSADVLDALGVRIDHDAGVGRRGAARARVRVPVRAGLPPGDAHAGPTRREIGVRTAFNLLGPLTNPAGAPAPALGVGDAGGCADGSPRSPPRSARSGRSSSTATGVDELPLDGTRRRSTTCTPDGDRAARRSTPTALGLRAAPTVAARRRRRRPRTPRIVEAVLRGEPGARRDVVAAQRRARRCSSPARVGPTRGGHRAGRADDRRRARGRSCSSALRAERRAAEAAAAADERPTRDATADRADGAASARRADRRSVVDEIAARRRADIRARAGATSRPIELARLAAAPPPRPVVERLAAPGPAPHRRDQARVAVGGRDRRRRRRHRRPGPRLRGRRRGRDLGPVRAALVRRLGRGPARRPRRGRACRCSPRSSSSTRASSPMLRAAGADPCCCSRSCTRHGASRGSSTRALDARPRAARRGPRRARARAALATDARAHRPQQPRPADARRSTRSGRRGCASSSRTTGS